MSVARGRDNDRDRSGGAAFQSPVSTDDPRTPLLSDHRDQPQPGVSSYAPGDRVPASYGSAHSWIPDTAHVSSGPPGTTARFGSPGTVPARSWPSGHQPSDWTPDITYRPQPILGNRCHTHINMAPNQAPESRDYYHYPREGMDHYHQTWGAGVNYHHPGGASDHYHHPRGTGDHYHHPGEAGDRYHQTGGAGVHYPQIEVAGVHYPQTGGAEVHYPQTGGAGNHGNPVLPHHLKQKQQVLDRARDSPPTYTGGAEGYGGPTPGPAPDGTRAKPVPGQAPDEHQYPPPVHPPRPPHNQYGYINAQPQPPERKPIKTSKTFDTNTVSDNQYYISICLCITLIVFCNPLPLICCIPAFYFASKSAAENKEDNYEKAFDYHKKAQFFNIGGFVVFILIGMLFFGIMILGFAFVSTKYGN